MVWIINTFDPVGVGAKFVRKVSHIPIKRENYNSPKELH